MNETDTASQVEATVTALTMKDGRGLPVLPPLNRRIHWVSSIDPGNREAIEQLQEQLIWFYSNNPHYYPALTRSEQWWKGDPYYNRIVEHLRATEGSVVEAGCGCANVLRHFPEFAARYTGFDFSANVLTQNAANFPLAKFAQIKSAREFPIETSSASILFSTWVLEHCAYPRDFLDECARAVKPDGTLIILTPDFLEGAPIPSQRCGLSAGAAQSKWQTGNKWDALLTAFDKKIKIPYFCRWLRWRQWAGQGFYINTRPACFEDPFEPDIDAVYLTWKKEIKDYLSDRIEWREDPPKVPGRHVICLIGRRRA